MEGGRCDGCVVLALPVVCSTLIESHTQRWLSIQHIGSRISHRFNRGRTPSDFAFLKAHPVNHISTTSSPFSLSLPQSVKMGTIGIPVKLIHEAVGHVVTVELKGGASYRGTLYDGKPPSPFCLPP